MSDILRYGDEFAANKTADSPSFYQKTSRAQKQFRPTSTIYDATCEILGNQ